MVHMPMRQQNRLDRELHLLNRGQNAVDIAARVDDHALAGLRIPPERAVLLEGGDGDDRGLQGHGRRRLYW